MSYNFSTRDPRLEVKLTAVPLSQDEFDERYEHWCQEPEAPPKVQGVEIDLYHLHYHVIRAGGSTQLNSNGSWCIIAARLGFVHIPADQHGSPAQSSLAVALELKKIYAEYLEPFDNAYMNSTVASALPSPAVAPVALPAGDVHTASPSRAGTNKLPNPSGGIGGSQPLSQGMSGPALPGIGGAPALGQGMGGPPVLPNVGGPVVSNGWNGQSAHVLPTPNVPTDSLLREVLGVDGMDTSSGLADNLFFKALSQPASPPSYEAPGNNYGQPNNAAVYNHAGQTGIAAYTAASPQQALAPFAPGIAAYTSAGVQQPPGTFGQGHFGAPGMTTPQPVAARDYAYTQAPPPRYQPTAPQSHVEMPAIPQPAYDPHRLVPPQASSEHEEIEVRPRRSRRSKSRSRKPKEYDEDQDEDEDEEEDEDRKGEEESETRRRRKKKHRGGKHRRTRKDTEQEVDMQEADMKAFEEVLKAAPEMTRRIFDPQASRPEQFATRPPETLEEMTEYWGALMGNTKKKKKPPTLEELNAILEVFQELPKDVRERMGIPDLTEDTGKTGKKKAPKRNIFSRMLNSLSQV